MNFLYPSNLIDGIKKQWSEYIKRFSGISDNVTFPKNEKLLMDVMYDISFEKEEDRQITTNMEPRTNISTILNGFKPPIELISLNSYTFTARKYMPKIQRLQPRSEGRIGDLA